MRRIEMLTILGLMSALCFSQSWAQSSTNEKTSPILENRGYSPDTELKIIDALRNRFANGNDVDIVQSVDALEELALHSPNNKIRIAAIDALGQHCADPANPQSPVQVCVRFFPNNPHNKIGNWGWENSVEKRSSELSRAFQELQAVDGIAAVIRQSNDAAVINYSIDTLINTMRLSRDKSSIYWNEQIPADDYVAADEAMKSLMLLHDQFVKTDKILAQKIQTALFGNLKDTDPHIRDAVAGIVQHFNQDATILTGGN